MRITRLVANFGLPLLAKELTEQAARKRTFVIRVVYATILFLMASLFFYQTLQFVTSSPLAVLGHGKNMFATLVGLQFAGIYFFMPAMASGVITQEKERASLQLLFLTRLGPWTILFEKLLGRLVPMGCFLLLSLPLLGFAYTLGGVSRDMLWKGAWMLFLATVQMGTLALACSAFFRTTVAAFMASYVIAFLMFFGPYFCLMIAMFAGWALNLNFERIFAEYFPNASPGLFIVALFPFFTPPYFFSDTLGAGGFGTWTTVAHSTIVLGVCAGFLALARRFLVDRAFLPPWNPLVSLFRARRRRAVPLRQSSPLRQPSVAAVAGVLPADEPVAGLREFVGFLADGEVAESLPADEPIAWRETTKRVLGDAKHIWLLLLIVEVPLIALCLLMGHAESYMTSLITAPLRFLMWLLAVLVILVKSASLVAGERTHQTLEVLCTSPLTGREIVLQKFRGVRRIIFALCLPFLTVSLFVPWWVERQAQYYRHVVDNFSTRLYMVCAVFSIAIYFPLVAWLSLMIGLRFKTQIRAIIGSMAAIAAWCIAPLVFIVLPLVIMADSFGRTSAGSDDWKIFIELASLLSPATIIFINEATALHEYPGPWLSVWLNFAVYGAVLVAIRATCLKNADRWLGRAEGKEPL